MPLLFLYTDTSPTGLLLSELNGNMMILYRLTCTWGSRFCPPVWPAVLVGALAAEQECCLTVMVAGNFLPVQALHISVDGPLKPHRQVLEEVKKWNKFSFMSYSASVCSYLSFLTSWGVHAGVAMGRPYVALWMSGGAGTRVLQTAARHRVGVGGHRGWSSGSLRLRKNSCTTTQN